MDHQWGNTKKEEFCEFVSLNLLDKVFVQTMVVNAGQHDMIQRKCAVVVAKQGIKGYEPELKVTRR